MIIIQTLLFSALSKESERWLNGAFHNKWTEFILNKAEKAINQVSDIYTFQRYLMC